MASRAAPAGPAFSARERRSSPRKPQGWWQRTRAAIHTAMVRLGWWLGGGALALGGLALAAALLSWQALDPSLNTATAEAPANWLGVPGSYTADALLQLLGWPVLLLAPVLLAWGLAVARQQPPAWGRRLAQALAGLLLLAMAVGALAMPLADAPAGPGGLPGLAMAWLVDWLADWPQLAGVPMGLSLGLLLAPLGLLLLALGTGLGLADLAGIGPAMGGLMRRWWPASAADDDAEEDVLPAQRRREPAVVAVPPAPDAAPGPVVVPREAAPAPGKRATQGRQAALDLGDTANLPGLDLLKPPPAGPRTRIDPASLEHNARLLEGVLEDFGVRGRIGEVRPGPVVTMYELEPAPGIKSSRVVGLADDIARSMSALSARVAVVPGRNAIGIELPNPTRETVSLAELLGSAAFDNKGATLPMVLGKDIGE
ncbi:MAG: DNA translocase FtsK 4TM domain-containing protein [Sphingomonadales bacterium]